MIIMLDVLGYIGNVSSTVLQNRGVSPDGTPDQNPVVATFRGYDTALAV
jgi:hypothetical protein